MKSKTYQRWNMKQFGNIQIPYEYRLNRQFLNGKNLLSTVVGSFKVAAIATCTKSFFSICFAVRCSCCYAIGSRYNIKFSIGSFSFKSHIIFDLWVQFASISSIQWWKCIHFICHEAIIISLKVLVACFTNGVWFFAAQFLSLCDLLTKNLDSFDIQKIKQILQKIQWVIKRFISLIFKRCKK